MILRLESTDGWINVTNADNWSSASRMLYSVYCDEIEQVTSGSVLHWGRGISPPPKRWPCPKCSLDKLCDMKHCSTNRKHQHIGAKERSAAFKKRQMRFRRGSSGPRWGSSGAHDAPPQWRI